MLLISFPEIKMMEEELKNERASSAMRSNQVDEATEALEKEKKEHEETQRRLEEITRQNEALIENYRKGVAFKTEIES